MKKSIYLAAALVLSVSFVASTMSLNASAARVNVNLHEAVNANDIKVVDAFTDSYSTFIKDVSKTAEGSVPNAGSYDILKANNDTLQKHSFKNLNDAYTASAADIQKEAASITVLAGTVNTSPFTYDSVITSLDDAMAVYRTKITAMTSAVALYEKKKDDERVQGNTTLGIVVGAAVVLVGGALTVFLVRKSKQVSNRRTALFANDPVATSFSKDQQLMLAELLENLYQFEKDYKKGDQALMNATRKYSYDLHYYTATNEQFGKYRAIAFEYAALVALGIRNDEQARAALIQAEQVRGDRNFYTETARNFDK